MRLQTVWYNENVNVPALQRVAIVACSGTKLLEIGTQVIPLNLQFLNLGPQDWRGLPVGCQRASVGAD